MTTERAYYLGFAEALLYAQAHNDREGGQQTLTTHLPQPGYLDDGLGFDFDKFKLATTIDDLNAECTITYYRFGKDQHGSDTIELTGSEGHFGLASWVP